MNKLMEILEKAKKVGKKTVAVAASEDEVVLKALDRAHEEGIINAILVGNVEKTKKIAENMGIDINKFEFVQAGDYVEAANKAVQLVTDGKAHFLMKGKIKTGDLMKVVLKEEYGLRTGRTLSLVSIFEVPNYHKLLVVSDAGMTIAPTLEQKVDIINNTVLVAKKALDVDNPKVAILGAVEIVNPKMPATVEAAILSQMSKRNQIKGCIVDGPFALDNAVSKEAAEHKGIKSIVAGDADVLIMPDIEAGNIFYKAMVFLAGANVASTIVGAKVPVALTSRADSDETKLLSLALTNLMAGDVNV
ncbi:phosphate butyryltransferase [Thermosipho affectus]|uniref:Phosphate butyryltransferase n=1 Tax=Thermosipho affectus TaxID=660294 RepID=A0ABX3IMJ4_9BACT|nr:MULTISPECIES: bifunctional enoyl-CoA hydratase/phosphate acetyltransferase [Thermosipho]ANQ53241.1 phosphate butyryltransferase [Thermosipho sp. 1070]APT71691.1 phosphate butyryltransferase [Thermosipho sp. 1063]ONN27717.1 phosphate butyryltransferase [Thermosipho affectus]OOC45206.1 phosphate butyryltransferase [Thermosipho sp. 1074]